MKLKVKLRAITPDDTDNIVRWRNNPSVMKNLYSQTYLTPEQHLSYLKNVVYAGKCIQYIIFIENSVKSYDIGTVLIKNIDRDSHKGEFGIFIGEDSARGKGYARLATKEILKIAFENLGFNRVYLTVMADNIPGIKTYEKAGFVQEGIMKEDYWRFNEYVDVIMMGITKNMWERDKNNQ